MTGVISFWTKNWLAKKEIPFSFLEIAESSNDLAKKQAFQNTASPFLFLVDQQTRGRGYENKKWENSDLMISFLWNNHLKEITASSCEAFAYDLKQALKKNWPALSLSVKAPNDLYLGSKKTAGILLEVLKQGPKLALIVGLGLNVLSGPKSLNAAYLAEKTKNIHFKKWESFLDDLFSLWSQRASFRKPFGFS